MRRNCVKWITPLLLLLTVSTIACAMTVVNSGDEDRPVIIEAAVPNYSQQALAARATGEVVLKLEIRPNGLVKAVKGLSGEPILVSDSKRTARLWKFAPVDQAIGIRKIQLIFVYRLVSKNTPFDQLMPVFKLPYLVEITHVIPGAESPARLVMFTWRKGSDELGTMLVPSGYSEETKTYAESVRTTLNYNDGSYIVLQLGGMITSPFFTEPEHQVLQSRRSRNLFVRTGTVRNTALLWREETPTGMWPATNRGFANVPKDRFSMFSEALESFKREKLTASAKTDSRKSDAVAPQDRTSSEITFCKFDLPDYVKRAHASFYLNYMFEIDKEGRPARVRKLSDEYVGEEKVLACVADWRFRGIEEGTRMALFLRWEHGIGWVELSVAGGGFSHVIRTQENSAASTPLR